MALQQDTEQFIVGIGASAGGLEAYNDFFDNTQDNLRISYILVQHLSPDYKSLLVDLLSRHTELRIFEAEDQMPIEPNCIYVIPPRKNLTVGEGVLLLNDKDVSDKGPNTSIDTFFYSLAEVYEDRAIAIILSGTGTDGSRGIEAVKGAGGLVIVQDPETAKFDGMPRSSLATGMVDLVLPTKAMHGEIIKYINDLPLVNLIENDIDPEVLKKILDVLYKNTGCDFQSYKLPTILRRLTRRLATLKIASVEQYLDYITDNIPESKIFCKDLLIGVTKFFRDKDAFLALRNKVLIPLIDSKEDNDTIKIWVTACSTGEEVYSIAIMLDDLLHQKKRKLQVKIFGTDLDAIHIEKASKAEYPEYINKEVPVEYLTRYFIKRENTYTVIPDIRKQVVFARHNVINDPPFIKNDLISCRNMLIYMNIKLQKTILSKFGFGLNNEGFLFLGPSESIAAANKLNFDELDRKWKIFRRNDSEANKSYPTRYDERIAFNSNLKSYKKPPLAIAEPVSLLQTVNAAILQDFAIAAFYIDRNYIIQETAGDYHRYLDFPVEGLKFNLLKMLPDPVSIPLNTAIIKGWKHREPSIINNLHCKLKGQSMSLVISVRPDAEADGHTLIIFNSTPYHFDEATDAAAELKDDTKILNKLKRELKESRFNLQTAIEELETTNEELQSSNEELLSSNEELQSSNEELQSLNEELHTLNAEHQLRIQDLIELNDDLNNYFRCSDIGQVIVDKNLNIRKFNPAASALINLIENDISRPITHLKTNFKYEGFEKDIREVLMDKTVVEKELEAGSNLTLLIRIYPFIRKGDLVDGALISFIDITGFKKLNSIINGVFDASKNSILALAASRNAAGKITDLFTTTSNAVANSLFGKNIAAERSSFRSVSRQLSDLIYNDLLQVIETGQNFNTELGFEGKWFDISAVKMLDGVALTMNDISERKDIEDRLRKNYSELYSAKEKLKLLNAELEKRVAERTNALSVSEERFRLVATVTSDVIIDWQLADNTLWVSENFGRLFGYDTVNAPFTRTMWMEHVHPEDRDRLVKSIHHNINNANPYWTQEYRYRNAKGNYHLIHDRGYLQIDENGMPYRMLSSMLDITDLRMAEKELRDSETRLGLALDVANLAAWQVDLKTGTIDYTKKMTDIFGLAPDAAATQEMLRAQLHPNDRHLVAEAIERSKQTDIYAYEARIVLPDQSIKWIKTIGNILRDDNGVQSRMIGITRETTGEKNASLELERKVSERTAEVIRASENLKRINAQLSKSNNDLEQFAYIASHDLQEPLRKIQTFISVVSQKKDDPGVVNMYFDKISSSAARMSSLIQNVLDFSRLSQTEDGFKPVDLNNTLSLLLVDFELMIKEKEAEIIVGGLPEIDAIPHQLSQLFFNLLSNALKFSRPNPKPRIELSARPLEKEEMAAYENLDPRQDYAYISFKDNGIGFDQKFSEKVFGFFYRLDNSEKTYKGNGIGLALCKKIVDNHLGVIKVRSEQNVGTEFTIILPVKHQ